MNNQWFSKIAIWLVIAMVLFTVFKQFDPPPPQRVGHVDLRCRRGDDDDKELIEIHNWKSLESINCGISNINQFFGNIHLIEKLTTCTITYYKQDLMKPQLMNFLTCCPNIKYLSLNSYYLSVPEEILFLLVKALKSLKTLIWNKEICSLSNYSAEPVSQNLELSTIEELS